MAATGGERRPDPRHGLGLRLSLYLAWRNLGKGEDPRYGRMRERIGPGFPVVSLVVVFLFQAGVAWVVSLPVQAA